MLANISVAMRPKEVSDRLQLDKIAKDHVWKVEPSCATTGEGIFEGLVSPQFPVNMECLLIMTRRGSRITSRFLLAANKASRPFSLRHLYDCMHSVISLASCIYPDSLL